MTIASNLRSPLVSRSSSRIWKARVAGNAEPLWMWSSNGIYYLGLADWYARAFDDYTVGSILFYMHCGHEGLETLWRGPYWPLISKSAVCIWPTKTQHLNGGWIRSEWWFSVVTHIHPFRISLTAARLDCFASWLSTTNWVHLQVSELAWYKADLRRHQIHSSAGRPCNLWVAVVGEIVWSKSFQHRENRWRLLLEWRKACL